MKKELSAHLSEEALDDALIGLSSPETEAHLALCGVCRSQLESFHTEMQLFNETSMAWCEARPARPFPAVSRSKKLSHAYYAPLGWAMAATVFLAIGVPIWNHDRHTSPKYDAASVSMPQDTEAQIAQDNELMRSVDAAISTQEASPLSEYKPSKRPQTHETSRSESRNR
jgi:hypothetical protein